MATGLDEEDDMTDLIPSNLSRRGVLALGGGTALVTASLSGCSFLSTDPNSVEQETGGGGGDVGAKESPMLAEKVKAGKLPPLEERLPTDPLVVEVPQAGSFGGTWHSVTIGPGDGAAFTRIVGYQPLLRKDAMVTETIPGVASAIEANDEGTEFTIKLREGMRWSDGEPFTADDIMFAMEEIWGNEELKSSPPSWLANDDELARAEKISDTEVKIIFSEPSGMFDEFAPISDDLLRFPKHYASKFLPKFNDNVEKEAKKAGFETWIDYFTDRAEADARWTRPGIPVLHAWMVTQGLGDGNAVKFERNPYFWRTDPDGRQLPYIDKLSFEVVTDPQVIALKTSDGELDLMYRHANNPPNKPVFAKSREDGDFQIVDNLSSSMNVMLIALNLANKNKDHRELYQNKDFRIGLSHAIDRKELITAVWQRQGEPWQAAPTKDSIYYDEEFAKQYTEFDVDLANEHLDKAGITEKDGKGYRTLPNGKPLTITLDIATAISEQWPAAADIIKGMWKEVGIRLGLNTIDRTLFYDRKVPDANQHDAGTWGGDGGLRVEMLDPRWYMPFSDESIYATTWARWFATGGKDGDEPIGPAKEQIQLYWELESTPDPAQREELFRQILEIAKREFWVIGISSTGAPYDVVSNRLKNYIGGIPSTWTYATPGHANPEGWYLDENA